MHMKYINVTLLLLAFTTTLSGQKHVDNDIAIYSHPMMQRNAQQWFGGFTINNDAVSEIRTHVFSKQPEVVGSTLHLDATIQSPTGTYYRFGQFINGQRVYGAEIVAHVDHFDEVRLITSNAYPTQLTEGTPMMESLPALSANDFLISDQRPVWLYDGQKLRPAIRMVHNDGLRFEESFVNNSGAIVFERDLNLYNNDTTVNVKVFNPDPLTSVQSIYATPYRDLNDQNTANLDPHRIDATVVANYDGSVFKLENSAVAIRDFDAPTFAPATETSPNFVYSRSNDRFEQVNAFYHITVYQDYMQSLGFNLVNYQIAVDANAWSGADQSSFNRSTNPPSMRFGEGGVDDAEDADVVLHEYGHAISASAAPGTNTGTERGCLDEAIGDYLAASYSRGISPYGYERVFTWDGHNEFWNGRFASNPQNKNYQSLSFTSIYTHTDIWASALMEIWGKIGRVPTDRIVLEGAYSFSSNITMPQAAMAIVDADSTLYGGQHIQPIWEAFVNHGILPANPVSLDELNGSSVQFYNTTAFSRGGNVDVSLNTANSYNYRIVDMMGRVLSSGEIKSGTERWSYSGYGLRRGTYILVIESNRGDVDVQKLIRLQ